MAIPIESVQLQLGRGSIFLASTSVCQEVGEERLFLGLGVWVGVNLSVFGRPQGVVLMSSFDVKF